MTSLLKFIETKFSANKAKPVAGSKFNSAVTTDPTPDEIQKFIDENCGDDRKAFVNAGGGKDDYTALWFLCSVGNYNDLYDCIEVLLENGADPNKVSYCRTALHSICDHDVRDPDIVELLVEYKADPNMRVQDGDRILGSNLTPIETLATSEFGDEWNRSILRALLRNGAKPEVSPEFLDNCPEKAMKILLKAGMKPPEKKASACDASLREQE